MQTLFQSSYGHVIYCFNIYIWKFENLSLNATTACYVAERVSNLL